MHIIFFSQNVDIVIWCEVPLSSTWSQKKILKPEINGSEFRTHTTTAQCKIWLLLFKWKFAMCPTPHKRRLTKKSISQRKYFFLLLSQISIEITSKEQTIPRKLTRADARRAMMNDYIDCEAWISRKEFLFFVFNQMTLRITRRRCLKH